MSYNTVQNIKIQIIKNIEIIMLFFVVITALAVIPVSEVNITNNAASYLQQSDKILNGQDPGLIFKEQKLARGLIYPLILAFSFKLLGKSVFSASLATRMFFGFGILLTYLLARIMYDKKTGLFAVFLVVTSYGIHSVAKAIDADMVVAFFVLLFVLFYYLSLIRSHWSWPVLTGVILGLAFMVKETALFCVGLPLLMIIFAPSGMKVRYIKIFFLIIISAIISLLPWLAYIAMRYGSVMPALGLANPGLQTEMAKQNNISNYFMFWLYLMTGGLGKGLYNYYYLYLSKVTPLAFLMIISWIFIMIRGVISKKLPELVLALSVFSFIPFILFLGHDNSRMSQTTMLYFLLYVILVVFVAALADLVIKHLFTIFNKTSKLKMAEKYIVLVRNIFIFIIISLLIVCQLLYSDEGIQKIWGKARRSLAIFSMGKFKVTGRFTPDQEGAVKWLKDNVSKKAKIMADGYSFEALEFFGVADHEIPIFHPKKSQLISTAIAKDKKEGPRPIYLITSSLFLKSGAKSYRTFYPIFEKEILDTLKTVSPDYLVMSGRGLFYRTYFDRAHWASLKYRNKSVRIYRIRPDKIVYIAFKGIGVNEEICDHLAWLEENYPNEYQLFKEQMGALNLTIEEIKNSRLRYPKEEVY